MISAAGKMARRVRRHSQMLSTVIILGSCRNGVCIGLVWLMYVKIRDEIRKFKRRMRSR